MTVASRKESGGARVAMVVRGRTEVLEDILSEVMDDKCGVGDAVENPAAVGLVSSVE